MHLSIEAASDQPGIALSSAGVGGVSVTWQTQQNHSKELLANIDLLLRESGATKADITAVFVDAGPGGYAALRVGVSTAKALAHAMGVPIVGVGRLELDARLVAEDTGERRVIAVHRAGRGDVAWAAYQHVGDLWFELEPPRITKPTDLYDALQQRDIVTGDIDPELQARLGEVGASVASAHEHRVTALFQAGHERLEAGRIDDPTTLVPLYLRAPAIGPQKQD